MTKEDDFLDEPFENADALDHAHYRSGVFAFHFLDV
jgi:hypothetical protein